MAVLFLSFVIDDWGFYAHRKINYYAALTIPVPLNRFFKKHITYLSTHAVDPDRRRYAVPEEGSRHFIDLDRWHFDDSLVLTEDFGTDQILRGLWEWQTADTAYVFDRVYHAEGRFHFILPEISLSIDSFGLRMEMMHLEFEDGENGGSLHVPIPSFLYPDQADFGRMYFTDSLSTHGVLPYYFTELYDRLVGEMTVGNVEDILKTCSDIGHYVSDAHVPLHTTSNYNGQFTDQLGIHAFWESRIPELFGASHFSSLTGRSEYMGHPRDFIWKIIKQSYSLVPDVLVQEREARKRVPEQNQYCYEDRGGQMVRAPCPVLAKEFMIGMKGMIQDQWMASIRSVGSVWYSAWIDAGKPDLWNGSDEISHDTTWIERKKEWLLKPWRKERTGLH